MKVRDNAIPLRGVPEPNGAFADNTNSPNEIIHKIVPPVPCIASERIIMLLV